MDCCFGALSMENWEQRITELEIRLAWQDELLSSLNDTIVRQQQTLDLQQAQLRLLYNKLHANTQEINRPIRLEDEIPPHY